MSKRIEVALKGWKGIAKLEYLSMVTIFQGKYYYKIFYLLLLFGNICLGKYFVLLYELIFLKVPSIKITL